MGLAELVRKGEVAPHELTAAAQRAIDVLNPVLNAVVRVLPADPSAALAPAIAALFRGVPFLIKDLGLSSWATNACRAAR